MKNHEKTLPEGYKEVYKIDAKNKKTGLIMNLVSIPMAVAAALPFVLLFKPNEYRMHLLLRDDLVFLVSLVAYIILHELVHGAAYKLLTKRRLTFGLSWSCAFCGVPDIYTYRRTALISLLSPFCVFSVLLIAAAAVFYRTSMNLFAVTGLIFAIHFGGCAGDLYMTLLLLFKFKNKKLLMRDTGPEQRLFVPAEQ